MRIKRNKGYVLMKRVNKKETMNYGKTKWLLVSFAKAPFEIIDGDRGKNYPKKKDFSQNGYCLFLNTKNVKSNGFNFDNREFITMKKDRTLRAGKLQRGDVVLTTRGTIGHTAYYSNSVSFNYIRINSGMLIFRPNESELCGEYLFYFFQSQYFKKKCDSIISGAAQPQLPIRSLNEAIIPLPKLKIQNRIVEILSIWDQAIEKLDKLILAKQKQFKWLLKKLIYDQKNNLGWKKVRLEKVLSLEYGKALKKSERKGGHYPVFGSNGIDGYHNEYLIKAPLIIVGRKGSAGKVNYYEQSGFPIDTTFYVKLKEPHLVSLKYLFFQLKKFTLNKLSSQSAVPGINRNYVYSIKILLPSLSEQKRITEILSKWEKEIQMLKQLSEKYCLQKKGLMQQLLTGKIKLQ